MVYGFLLAFVDLDKYGGRKIHYTMDVIMALCWGFACGFSSFLPYWYPVWITIVVVHRAVRDIEHCRKKYGDVCSYKDLSDHRNGRSMNGFVRICLYLMSSS
jgi:Ergosterol biosynthesis ERG4/ERG24 family